MKFRDLERGPIEGRTEDFELPGGTVVKVRVMPLLAGRDREIEVGAAEYAKANNAEAKPSEPTYERGIYAHTILRTILDPEDGAPFFASVEQMLDPNTGLDRDRLAYLFELQQQAQADFAPRGGQLTSDRYFLWLEQTATAEEGADLPFERSPRGTQRSFVRGIARSYKDLLASHWALLQEVARSRSETSSPPVKSSSGPNSADMVTSSPVSAASSAKDPNDPTWQTSFEDSVVAESDR